MDVIFDTKTVNDRAMNRKCFMKILQAIRLLAHRNFALVDKQTRNSNVYHFTKLRAAATARHSAAVAAEAARL